jgi:hypothetical protein
MLPVSPRSGRQRKAHGESASRGCAAPQPERARAAGDSAMLGLSETNRMTYSFTNLIFTYSTENILCRCRIRTAFGGDAVARCAGSLYAPAPCAAVPQQLTNRILPLLVSAGPIFEELD